MNAPTRVQITVAGKGIIVWDRGTVTSEPAWLADEMREVIGQKLIYPQTGPTFTGSLTTADQAVWTARALWPTRVTADVEIALPPGYENMPGVVY